MSTWDIFRCYVRRDWRSALCRFLLRDLWKKRDLWFCLSTELEKLLKFFPMLKKLISLSLDFNYCFFWHRILWGIENAKAGDWKDCF
jgi:hypothetical protein